MPFADGGPTAEVNLGAAHRGHHNDHTHHGWRVEQPQPGRFVWTAPTGHRYHVDPEVIGPFLELPAEADPDPPPF